MTEALQFAVLGLGLAAIYALLAQGIVLIYRGSGVINLAHGAFALVGAIIFTELRSDGAAVIIALVAATVAVAAIGALTQLLVMGPLRRAAPIARIIATLGLFMIIQSAAALEYGSALVTVPQWLPQETFAIGGVDISTERLMLFGAAILITAGLMVAQRVWLAGLATRAAAENELAASTLGWSPNALATMNWAIGGALAGLAGALIVPLTGLLVGTLTLLVVPALAAALLGRFDSFGGTLLGATAIGVAQSVITRYWAQSGVAEALPFVIIIVILVFAGRSLPLRSHVLERLPSIGRGVVRPLPVAVTVLAAALATLFWFDATWISMITVTFAISTVYLSIVVLTGYAGQISLAQFALAGLGAYVAGRLISAEAWAFGPAALAGIVAAVPIGVIFALPALRTRGVNLTVVTLGLGVAVHAVLFSNTDYTGGIGGTSIGEISLLGLELTRLSHPERYAIFVLIVFLVAALAVANLRRGSQGRRLIAIRQNERAAAALGISVVGTKLYAFTFAAIIASMGGILIGFMNTSIVYPSFDPVSSIIAVSYTVIGGVGFVFGPLFGSTLASGGFGSTLFHGIFPSLEDYLALIGGVAVIVMLIAQPNGIVARVQQDWGQRNLAFGPIGKVIDAIGARVPGWMKGHDWEQEGFLEESAEGLESREGGTLRVEGLTVRFGAVTAVDDVSLDVEPGEVVGLIGPNGAGKTTLIDAVSGFVDAAHGSVTIDGREIGGLPAYKRVQAGVGRSWQSLELFDDVSVMENLQIASEAGQHGMADSLRAVLPPPRPRLTPAAAQAIDEFQLAEHLSNSPEDLSFGQRRQVAIARTVALNPSVLLLDEPAAGLGGNEADELGALLRSIAKDRGTTVLLVEHNVDLVMSVSDRVVVLNFGGKIAEGTPAEIIRNQDVIDAYLGVEEEDPDLGSGSAPVVGGWQATPERGS